MWLRSGCLVTDQMHSAPGGEGKGGRLLAVQLQAWLFVEVHGKVTEPLPTTVMVPLDAHLAHHIAPAPAPAQ